MELYTKGILKEEQIGCALPFGDADGMIEMVKWAAHRQGFGTEIADGSWRLANRYGHPEMSVTAKKLEFASYDPRGLKGMGLLYATSNIGASHMAGDTAYMELFGVGEKIDGLTYEGKGALVKYFQDLFVIMDAVGMCVFVALRYTLDTKNGYVPTRLTEMINQATGSSYTPDSLLEAADRVYTLVRGLTIPSLPECSRPCRRALSGARSLNWTACWTIITESAAGTRMASRHRRSSRPWALRSEGDHVESPLGTGAGRLDRAGL
jgi:aldehyde:ferredoxin oxidoreductase